MTWTAPAELLVGMYEPTLVWRPSMGTSPHLHAVNSVNAAMPGWTWRVGVLLRAREWVVRHYLGSGDNRLSFTSPSGHDAVLLAVENYPIDASTATLDGRDLGEPVVLDENPTVGDVALPRAGFLPRAGAGGDPRPGGVPAIEAAGVGALIR